MSKYDRIGWFEYDWKAEFHRIQTALGVYRNLEGKWFFIIEKQIILYIPPYETKPIILCMFFHCQGIFKIYDADKSRGICANELREALKKAHIKVNNRILKTLLLRYANENGQMEMEDFLACCIKLNHMIGKKTFLILFNCCVEHWSVILVCNKIISLINTFV